MNRAPQLGDLWPNPTSSSVPLVSIEWPRAGGERCPCVKAYQQEPNGSMGWHWRAATPEQAAAAGFTVAASTTEQVQGHKASAVEPVLSSSGRSTAEQAQQIADRILGNADATGGGQRGESANPPPRRTAELSAREAQAIAERILSAECDDEGDESPDAVARRILDS